MLAVHSLGTQSEAAIYKNGETEKLLNDDIGSDGPAKSTLLFFSYFFFLSFFWPCSPNIHRSVMCGRRERVVLLSGSPPLGRFQHTTCRISIFYWIAFALLARPKDGEQQQHKLTRTRPPDRFVSALFLLNSLTHTERERRLLEPTFSPIKLWSLESTVFKE